MPAIRVYTSSGWQDVAIKGADGAQGIPGINWRGNWINGAVYNTNDGVFYQSSSWIANQPASGAGGSEPGGAYSLWTLLAQGTPPPFVTALPTGVLLDGQEVYYQSAAMATDGAVWHLRFRLGAPHAWNAGLTGSWEFIGGTPIMKDYQVQAVFNSYAANTWGGFDLNDPQFVLPLAGDYIVRHSVVMTTSVLATLYSGIRIGATEADTTTAAFNYSEADHVTGGTPIMQTRRLNSIAAGTTLYQRYRHNAASAANITRNAASMEATPVRVG